MIRVERIHTFPQAVDPYRLLKALLREGYRRPALLESALPGSRLHRWSFAAVEPFAEIAARGERIIETRGGQTRRYRLHPLRAFQNLLDAYRAEPLSSYSASDEESPFRCGAAALLSYDMARLIDPFPSGLPVDASVPDLDAAFYAAAAAVDHLTNKTHFYRAAGLPRAEWVRRAVQLCEETASQPAGSLAGSLVSGLKTLDAPPRRARSSMTRAEYMRAAEAALRYIAQGDIYQANVARLIDAPWQESPLELYGRLREQNPAPLAAYIEGSARQVALSSSPERFLRYDAPTRRLETRPIKGTRPVGRLEELLQSEKEAAELVMIVDMERNDLGRVCEYGSVRVPEPRSAESYATVAHTYAVVEGTVREGEAAESILRAAFPGGSITGAPKRRAVQIIRELERRPRGLYTGALGYFDLSGSFDLSVAIRVLTVRGGRARLGVGSGIVADSDPAAEYEETRHKAAGLLRALNAEERGG